MDFSVVVVSYNVKYFLDQCLVSVLNATRKVQAEIIVVDNDSKDGTTIYIPQKFPQIKFIANKKNVGFSAANNIGFEHCTSPYVFILNPDTLITEQCVTRLISFFEEHELAGGVGLRMLDGNGAYLPESKRGFPSPWVSFCKIFGLSSLFPKSSFWNGYYLGHFNDQEVQKVDVLSGACMCVRREILEQIGGFDEDYFMYGEDIDISYRIKKAGYQNYYLPEPNIIHYKGESTRKASFNYIKHFYRAMLIFSKKHLTPKMEFAYNLSIKSAIYFHGLLTFITSWIRRLSQPLLDASILIGSFLLSKFLWANYYHQNPNYFSTDFYYVNLPLYTILGILTFLVFGRYHQRRGRLGLGIASIAYLLILLAVYALFPESIRNSRIVLMLGGLIGLSLIYLKDGLFSQISKESKIEQNTAIVGYGSEQPSRLLGLMDKRSSYHQFSGFVGTSLEDHSKEKYLGDVSDVESVLRFHNIKELIFNQRSLTSEKVMQIMTSLGTDYRYLIYTPGSEFLIDSNSKISQGQVDAFEISYQISTPYHIMLKRLFDVITSLIIILLLPLFWVINKFNLDALLNPFKVLFGVRTWVGYINRNEEFLPVIKNGIISHEENRAEWSVSQKRTMDFIYAREYNLLQDLRAFFLNLTRLG